MDEHGNKRRSSGVPATRSRSPCEVPRLSLAGLDARRSAHDSQMSPTLMTPRLAASSPRGGRTGQSPRGRADTRQSAGGSGGSADGGGSPRFGSESVRQRQEQSRADHVQRFRSGGGNGAPAPAASSNRRPNPLLRSNSPARQPVTAQPVSQRSPLRPKQTVVSEPDGAARASARSRCSTGPPSPALATDPVAVVQSLTSPTVRIDTDSYGDGDTSLEETSRSLQDSLGRQQYSWQQTSFEASAEPETGGAEPRRWQTQQSPLQVPPLESPALAWSERSTADAQRPRTHGTSCGDGTGKASSGAIASPVDAGAGARASSSRPSKGARSPTSPALQATSPLGSSAQGNSEANRNWGQGGAGYQWCNGISNHGTPSFRAGLPPTEGDSQDLDPDCDPDCDQDDSQSMVGSARGKVEELCDKAHNLVLEMTAFVTPSGPHGGFPRGGPGRPPRPPSPLWANSVASTPATPPWATAPGGPGTPLQGGSEEVPEIRHRLAQVEMELDRIKCTTATGAGCELAAIRKQLDDMQVQLKDARGDILQAKNQICAMVQNMAGVPAKIASPHPSMAPVPVEAFRMHCTPGGSALHRPGSGANTPAAPHGTSSPLPTARYTSGPPSPAQQPRLNSNSSLGTMKPLPLSSLNAAENTQALPPHARSTPCIIATPQTARPRIVLPYGPGPQEASMMPMLTVRSTASQRFGKGLLRSPRAAG
mmetsp:Transcript_40861/g.89405  ORF Transcript_40861/g.89405 Transcript_40861/m.89405 type:complete len:708 (+) Transcript_40861:117-2240(+)